MEDIMYLFCFLGMIVACGICILVVAILVESIKERISKVIYKYKYKHRFDKKPIAKCYCIDCYYRNAEEECCNPFTTNRMKVADNWFCYCAKPKDGSGVLK